MPELTVLYDGECGLCRKAAGHLRRADRWNRLELLPLQEPSLARRFPGLDPRRALATMLAVDAAGRVSAGVDAYARIGRLLPGWRRAAWLLRVPGLHGIAALAYAWVARHRYRWNKKDCADGHCAYHPHPPA